MVYSRHIVGAKVYFRKSYGPQQRVSAPLIGRSGVY